MHLFSHLVVLLCVTSLSVFSTTPSSGLSLESKNLSAVIQYLESGGNPNDLDNLAIRTACSIGCCDIVKTLLDWRCPNGALTIDPRAKGNQAIQNACSSNHTKVVELLLAWNGSNGEWVDPRVNYNWAVRSASENGNNDIVKVLLAWRGPKGEYVDATTDSNYAIRWAAYNGHLVVVKTLLSWKGSRGESVSAGRTLEMLSMTLNDTELLHLRQKVQDLYQARELLSVAVGDLSIRVQVGETALGACKRQLAKLTAECQSKQVQLENNRKELDYSRRNFEKKLKSKDVAIRETEFSLSQFQRITERNVQAMNSTYRRALKRKKSELTESNIKLKQMEQELNEIKIKLKQQDDRESNDARLMLALNQSQSSLAETRKQLHEQEIEFNATVTGFKTELSEKDFIHNMTVDRLNSLVDQARQQLNQSNIDVMKQRNLLRLANETANTLLATNHDLETEIRRLKQHLVNISMTFSQQDTNHFIESSSAKKHSSPLTLFFLPFLSFLLFEY